MAGRQPYDNQVSIQAITPIESVTIGVYFSSAVAQLLAGETLAINVIPEEGYIYNVKAFSLDCKGVAGATTGFIQANISMGVGIARLISKTPTARIKHYNSQTETSTTLSDPTSNSDFIKIMDSQVIDADLPMVIRLTNITNATLVFGLTDYFTFIFEKVRVS